MTELYLIAGMATVTFLIRYILFAISGESSFPIAWRVRCAMCHLQS